MYLPRRRRFGRPRQAMLIFSGRFLRRQPVDQQRIPVKEEENMLRTRLCDLLGSDLPIILAGMGAGATSAEFAAAVSNQGGLGSVGSLFRTKGVGIQGLRDVIDREIAVGQGGQ